MGTGWPYGELMAMRVDDVRRYYNAAVKNHNRLNAPE